MFIYCICTLYTLDFLCGQRNSILTGPLKYSRNMSQKSRGKKWWPVGIYSRWSCDCLLWWVWGEKKIVTKKGYCFKHVATNDISPTLPLPLAATLDTQKNIDPITCIIMSCTNQINDKSLAQLNTNLRHAESFSSIAILVCLACITGVNIFMFKLSNWALNITRC